MGRDYIPIYIVLALMLAAAIWWYEQPEETVQPYADAFPEETKKRSRIWAFLPPVSFQRL